MSSFAVVALFSSLDIGTTINRQAWPAHVTLASNFTASATTDQITRAVTEAAPFAEALTVRFGEPALFGPNRDVRVRLVDSQQAVSVHGRLVDQLEGLPAFAAEEPGYWREGYRPHLTLGPSVTAAEGDRETASCIAVVQILDTDAKVLATFHAPGAR